MIPQDKIEEIKDANDVVDVISGYVALLKSGKNFKALCPFHSEKTPSFVVSPEKQIYHCFGCGKGGNVFSFIEEIEKVSFVESVEFLAKKAGVSFKFSADKVSSGEKEKILALNKEALEFFKRKFKENKDALLYAEKRGITEEAVNEFQLGFAPGGGALYGFLKKKGYDENLMIKSWLISENIRDTFNNRIIFPIFNTYGEPIAFGGRVFDNSLPKYINSGDTPVYIKGRNLYNLNNARKHGGGVMVVTEGYTDVMAVYGAGIKNVVATLGTALTVEQAKLLKRYTQKAVILYDSDEAGRAGAVRGGEILFSAGIEVKAAVYEGVKDPDEFIKKYGPGALKKCINEALPIVDFKINYMKEKGDVASPYYRDDMIKETAFLIDKADNVMVKNYCVSRAAVMLGVNENIIRDYLEKGEAGGESLKKERAEGEQLKKRGIDMAEGTIFLSVMGALETPDEVIVLKHFVSKRAELGVDVESFNSGLYGEILGRIEYYYKRKEKEILKKIELDYADSSEAMRIISGALVGRIVKGGGDEKTGREKRGDGREDEKIGVISDCMKKIWERSIVEKLSALQASISRAEEEGRLEDLAFLLKEKTNLQKILKQRGE